MSEHLPKRLNRFGRGHRGVSSIIAAILMVLMTVVLFFILLSFRPPLPQQQSSLYYSIQSGITAPTWGDLTDCADITNPGSCSQQPAVDIIFSGQSPPTMPVSSLEFYFFCNGTVYLHSTLTNMIYVPSTNHGTNFNCGGTNSNCLGKCGTFDPSQVFGYQIPFNRLGYFWQLHPNATYLSDGDSIMLYLHSSVYPLDQSHGGYDTDDYHGIPSWCFTVQNACTLKIVYDGPPQAAVLTIPVQSLAV